MQTATTPANGNGSVLFPVAPLGTRIGAFLLDLVIVVIYLIMMSSAFISMDIEEEWLWMLFVILPVFSFGLICELMMDGQTPGKRITNLRVVKLDGTSPKTTDYLLRWACGLIDFIFLCGFIALIIAAGSNGQRLGDIVARTRVVKSSGEERTNASTVLKQRSQIFPQVGLLDQYYVELMERALQSAREHNNPKPVELVCERIKSLLDIQTEMSSEKLLTILVNEFNALNTR